METGRFSSQYNLFTVSMMSLPLTIVSNTVLRPFVSKRDSLLKGTEKKKRASSLPARH